MYTYIQEDREKTFVRHHLNSCVQSVSLWHEGLSKTFVKSVREWQNCQEFPRDSCCNMSFPFCLLA